MATTSRNRLDVWIHPCRLVKVKEYCKITKKRGQQQEEQVKSTKGASKPLSRLLVRVHLGHESKGHAWHMSKKTCKCSCAGAFPKSSRFERLKEVGTNSFFCTYSLLLTPRKRGNPLILGNDPIFKGSWRLQVVYFSRGGGTQPRKGEKGDC